MRAFAFAIALVLLLLAGPARAQGLNPATETRTVALRSLLIAARGSNREASFVAAYEGGGAAVLLFVDHYVGPPREWIEDPRCPEDAQGHCAGTWGPAPPGAPYDGQVIGLAIVEQESLRIAAERHERRLTYRYRLADIDGAPGRELIVRIATGRPQRGAELWGLGSVHGTPRLRFRLPLRSPHTECSRPSWWMHGPPRYRSEHGRLRLDVTWMRRTPTGPCETITTEWGMGASCECVDERREATLRADDDGTLTLPAGFDSDVHGPFPAWQQRHAP
jgi:hypothetical protein